MDARLFKDLHVLDTMFEEFVRQSYAGEEFRTRLGFFNLTQRERERSTGFRFVYNSVTYYGTVDLKSKPGLQPPNLTIRLPIDDRVYGIPHGERQVPHAQSKHRLIDIPPRDSAGAIPKIMEFLSTAGGDGNPKTIVYRPDEHIRRFYIRMFTLDRRATIGIEMDF